MDSLEEKVEFLASLTEYLSVKDSFAYNPCPSFPEFRKLRDFLNCITISLFPKIQQCSFPLGGVHKVSGYDL